jgi:hypothetical protein
MVRWRALFKSCGFKGQVRAAKLLASLLLQSSATPPSPVPADENAGSVHPLPQGGEGSISDGGEGRSVDKGGKTFRSTAADLKNQGPCATSNSLPPPNAP